ncbi:MAG: type II secretion system protein [Pirellulaceae bacterium]
MSAPQSFPTCHRRTSRGHGFTLIELLVVITVIAILAALILPAVFSVSQTANETTVTNDITQLDAAVEKFRSEFGFYPSDFSEFVDLTGNPLDFTDTLPDGSTVETRLKRFLTKISPMHNEDAIDPVDGSLTRLAVWWENVGKNLAVNFGGSSKAENLRGPQVALWYWLMQTYNDAQYPFSGKRRGTTTADSNGDGIPDNAEIISEKRVFADIGTLELIFTANYPDGQPYEIARALQRGGDAPLLYFHNDTYVDPYGSGVEDTTVINFAPGATNPNLGLPCRVPGSNLIDGLFVEPNRFQIVTAGWDESFGDIEDKTIYENNDNLCNFAEGRLDIFVDASQ